MKYFYTYVLKSTIDGKLYTGWSENVRDRLDMHNNGLVAATKSRVPFELVYFEGCLDKAKAIKREIQLKTGFGRAYLKRRLG